MGILRSEGKGKGFITIFVDPNIEVIKLGRCKCIASKTGKVIIIQTSIYD